MHKARCSGDSGATSARVICVGVLSSVIACNLSLSPVHLTGAHQQTEWLGAGDHTAGEGGQAVVAWRQNDR